VAVDEAVIADLHAAAHAEMELLAMENAHAAHVETIYYSAACASTATLTAVLTVAAAVWTQDSHGSSETVAMLASRHDFDSQDDGDANLLWTLWAGVVLVPMTFFVFTLLLLLRVVLHDGAHSHHTQKQGTAAAAATASATAAEKGEANGGGADGAAGVRNNDGECGDNEQHVEGISPEDMHTRHVIRTVKVCVVWHHRTILPLLVTPSHPPRNHLTDANSLPLTTPRHTSPFT